MADILVVMLLGIMCVLTVANGQIHFGDSFRFKEEELVLKVGQVYDIITSHQQERHQQQHQHQHPAGTEKFDKCSTNDEGPRKNVPCIFPFLFGGRTFVKCTNEFDAEKRFWCSTKVDENQNHISHGGNWGYCNSHCSFSETDKSRYHKPPRTTTAITTSTIYPFSELLTTATTTRITTTSTVQNSIQSRKPSDLTEEVEEEELCGLNNGAGFIVGGQDAKRGSFPFVALLGYKDHRIGITYGCGGTLISRRYVVTAAHCHHSTDARLQIAEVVLGEHIINIDPDCEGCSFVQKFEIQPDDVTMHPDYIPEFFATNGNDIAIIRLPRDAITAFEDPDSFIMPICLPKTSWDIVEEASEHLVVGWGRTSNEVSSVPVHRYNILQQLRVPVLSPEVCKTKYPDYKFIDPRRQFCAGGTKGQDSCNGDSGGPLIAVHHHPYTKMFLAGIVSFGTSYCGMGLPGVYTNISFYVPWIRENMIL